MSYTNIKLPHFPNILRSILNSFYFKNILKKILVTKFSLFKVTNKIGKINPILNGHKTVSYTNIKFPHFFLYIRVYSEQLLFKNKLWFRSFCCLKYNQIDKINPILNSPKLGPNIFFSTFFLYN